MQRPTFTATAVMDARRNGENGSMELNLVDAKGNTQNLVLDSVAVGHILTAMLQKSKADGELPEIYLNESIPLVGMSTFRVQQHVGLRMYINPTSVIDFVFLSEYQGVIKGVLERLSDSDDMNNKQ